MLRILALTTALTLSAQLSAAEITPFIGHRGGGNFVDEQTDTQHSIRASNVRGLIISFPYKNDKELEVYYSHQSSELQSVTVTTPTTTTGKATVPLRIDYLHLGGRVHTNRYGQAETFVDGGLGLTYMNPEFTDTRSELRASMSIGLGMLYDFSKDIALRVEVRGQATLFSNNASLFCNGGCALSINGNYFLQGEALAGITIRF